MLARDGQRDSIDCGVGEDRVVADAIDVVSSNCETVEKPATSGGDGGNGGAKLAAARAKLTRAGCKGKVLRVRSSVRRGRVAGLAVTRAGKLRTVRAGRPVAAGAVVFIKVSKGRG